MRTKALEPQRANEKRAHRKKTGVVKEISKAKACKAKVSSKSKTSKSKSKPEPKTTIKTKAKAKASQVPAPLRPIGLYADGSPRLLPERKKRQIQIPHSSDDDDDSECKATKTALVF